MCWIDTLYWKIEDVEKDESMIAEAAKIILNGGIIAFPTETVYGLGANAFDKKAVQKIFQAKKRPADNPLIVHVSSIDMMNSVVDMNDNNMASRLIERFWPGPLTLILAKKSAVPEEVSAGFNTVAVRMPDHPVALKLIEKSSVPIAAPSANLSGKPSPTTAQHVLEDLRGSINGVIDAGEVEVGIESTVIDTSVSPPVILRVGAVTVEEIRGVIGDVTYEFDTAAAAPKSPGMKYRHYAPKAKVILIEGDVEKIRSRVLCEIKRYKDQKKTVGIFAGDDNARYYSGVSVINYGKRDDAKKAANMLYGALRRFDEIGVDVILVEAVEESGIGIAVMDRIRKASEKK